jgi:hypothetical protein
MWAQTDRSRTYSERYGARSPWLSGPVRAGAYLIWRGVFASLRPLLFLGLLIAAAWIAYRGLETAPDGALQFSKSLSDQFDAALYEAARSASAGPVLTRWNAELTHALRPGPTGGPDLLRAQSFAASLPAMMGEEALALHLMRHERRPDMMQVDLVAMPVWRRSQIVTGVLRARSDDAHRLGIDPVWLIESSPDVQHRYARAQRLYGASLQAAEHWFVRPGSQALNLEAFADLTTAQATDPVILPDAREVIALGCALARIHGQTVPACTRARPAPVSADPVRTALALSVYDPELEASAVRLALAARAAGRLEGDWLEALLLGQAVPERDLRLLTALMPVLAEADRYYAQPEACAEACRRAMAEFATRAGYDGDARRDWFAAYDQVRRQDGALVTIRVSDILTEADSLKALVRISAISEGRLLAARVLLGRELTELDGADTYFWRAAERLNIILAGALASLALLLLGIVLISGRFRRSGGAPGAFERFDGQVSRLILGRNI